MPESCLFCRLVRGDIPSARVAETTGAIAFRDINAQAPVHVLIIPRVHVDSLDSEIAADVLGDLLVLTASVARQEGIAESGYRTVINTGKDGGQTVGHLHVHLLGGRPLSWPPG